MSTTTTGDIFATFVALAGQAASDKKAAGLLLPIHKYLGDFVAESKIQAKKAALEAKTLFDNQTALLERIESLNAVLASKLPKLPPSKAASVEVSKVTAARKETEDSPKKEAKVERNDLDLCYIRSKPD